MRDSSHCRVFIILYITVALRVKKEFDWDIRLKQGILLLLIFQVAMPLFAVRFQLYWIDIKAGLYGFSHYLYINRTFQNRIEVLDTAYQQKI